MSRPLNVELLLASGALEGGPRPSVWRAWLTWLMGPSPWGDA
jgi:hypothetical protein